MGYLLKYVKLENELPNEALNLTDIINKVENIPDNKSYQSLSSATHTSHPYTKKTVPDLDEFKGTDEDSFGWLEDTLTKLGTAGLARYLSDTRLVTQNPDLMESVFYALRRATMNGLTKHVSEDLITKKVYDPVQLWSNIKNYYDVNVNKANVILYEIKRLLSLELNSSVQASKFISDFKECLNCLQKVKATIANNNETLRALLLLAIQDQNFDPV